MREKIQQVKNTVSPRPPKAVAAVLNQKDRQIRLLSQLVIVMGAFNAVATLPQAISLWSTRDSGGLSILSWSYYLMFSVVLLVYGIVMRQRPLVVTYGSSVFMYGLIVVGIVLY